jgi:hypothetical protein
MRIGIDVSQVAYRGTGVANYLSNLVSELIKKDTKNEYVLLFCSLRRPFPFKSWAGYPNVKVKEFKIPPTALDLIWNKLHVLPVEKLIGDVDLFISSDWVEPPSTAKKATIIYDLIIHKYPEETDQKIVSVQKRKLKWVKKESDTVFCISESTKNDVKKILGIESSRIKVIYPGL